MPATSITDMSATTPRSRTTPTGGPDLYAHSRTTFDGDATWTKLMPFAVTVGYTHNDNGYDARIFESSNENVFRCRPTRSDPRGSPSAPNTSSAIAPVPGSTKRC